jgi:hypothetical protein
MKTQQHKPPRQWAAEIAALASLEQRRESLQKVQQHLRPIVETHLKNFWLRKKHNAAE